MYRCEFDCCFTTTRSQKVKDILKLKIESILERIITINHAWKLARDEYGARTPLTQSLREQKSSWQATLIRDYPKHIYLKVDTDNSSEDETLLSVRLKAPIIVGQVRRTDAEHIPLRIAKNLFWEDELKQLIK